VILWLQIALGGWVSTNYAVLACPDFPTCNGQWVPAMNWQGFSLWRELGLTPDGQVLPFVALSSIHFVHRSAAWLVLAVLLGCGWRLRQQQGLQTAGRLLLGLSTLQFITGLSNVVFDWPLLAAVFHTGGAAAMVVTLTWVLSISRAEHAPRFSIPSRPAE
jgi:cytochrome c oxidase assembly protein subunit 15